MFYAHFVLAKKGPLARIWLAAHWDKKLTKAHVFETNIEKSVDGILQPKVKMALRTSGHLLLGVVRIYSRKAKYLLADCNEAFVKIKMAFRPGMVDLPEEHREAAVTAITLPEVFHDFDSAMPELNDVDIEAQFCMNQSRAEEITMREDYGNVPLASHDDSFGDMGGFDSEAPELMRSPHALEPSLDQAGLLFTDGPSVDHVTLAEREKTPQPSTSAGQSTRSLEIDAPIRDDGFGGNLGQDIIAGGLFEGGFFDDAPMGDVSHNDSTLLHPSMDGGDSITAAEKPISTRAISTREPDSDDDMGDRYDAVPSPRDSSHGDSRPGSPLDSADLAPPMMPPPELIPAATETPFAQHPEEHAAEEDHDIEQENEHPDQTTLLHNEEESFALAPVDASALKGVPKTKRKRKLIVDETKNISGEEMKSQLSDTSDILTTLDLAPPTKRLMHWKETGGVEKLFALPGRPIPARVLFKSYQRHLTSKAAQNDDHGIGDDRDPLPLDNMEDLLAPAPAAPANLPPPPPPAPLEPPRRGRKRKLQDPEEAMPPAQRKANEEDDDEEAAPLAPETPLPVNNLPVDNHHLMDGQAPLAAHLDQTGGPLSVPATYHDPHTPGPVSVAPSYLDPHTPGGPLSVAPSYLDPHTPGGPLSVAGQFMDPQTPGSLLDQSAPGGPLSVPPSSVHISMHHDIPELPIDQVDMLLQQHDTSLPQVDEQSTDVSHTTQDNQLPHPEVTPEQRAFMENVGYDQNNPMMTNMGYDGHGDHHPAMTPGAISERGPNTPWNDDYEFPHSVGPPEEQQTDETYEQFEERVLNKRAAHMYTVVKNKLAKSPDSPLYLSEMTQRNSKKQAAQKFYTLLVLKKHQVLELQQDCSYGEILVSRGKKFDNPSL